MDTEVLAPRYRIRRVTHGSPEYASHLALVTAAYLQEGFIDSSDRLPDQYDGPTARYYLLSPLESPEECTGTFRILEGKNVVLPALIACPNHPIEGIREKICESTRVTAKHRPDFIGRTRLSRYVLFEAVIQAVVHLREHELWAVISLGSPVIFEWINTTFCGSQRAFGAPFWYHGGMVVPSIIWRDEFERIVAHDAPHLFAYYLRAVEEAQAN